MEEVIKQIQKKIVKLLRTENRQPLSVNSKDNCSELARLTGCWIMKKCPTSKASILKGRKILKTRKSHDLLIVEDHGISYIIDPAVWQFFKTKRTILIGQTTNSTNCLIIANKIYGGDWQISEKFGIKKYDPAKLIKIVNTNIKQSKQTFL